MTERKIMRLDELAARCAAMRADGIRIAHCHGAFDLLHPGHVAHLEAARALADALVVTVTDDPYIRKGPGRPVFDAATRATMLAALECVSFVAVSPYETAVETLQQLRPDLYVKGRDYRRRANDLTGAIAREEATIKALGGRLVLTDEPCRSSTALINTYTDVFNPAQRAYLASASNTVNIPDLADRLERAAETRVLVVGDAAVVESVICGQDGTPVQEHARRRLPGGIEALGDIVRMLTRNVVLLGGVGADGYETATNGDETAPAHAGATSRLPMTMVVSQAGPTLRYVRYELADTGCRFFEDVCYTAPPVDVSTGAAFVRTLESMARDADMVIVRDAGQGWMTPDVLEALHARSVPVALRMVNDTRRPGPPTLATMPDVRPNTRFADHLLGTETELRLLAGADAPSIEELPAVVAERTGAERVTLVLPSGDIVHWDRGKITKVPALSSRPRHHGGREADVLTAAAAVAPDMPPESWAFLAACMMALSHEKLDRVRLRKTIDTLLKQAD